MASLKEILSKKSNQPVVSAVSNVPPRRRIPRPEHTQLEKYLVIAINGNALIQFLADIVLEVLHLIPTRINHMSLTLLNAFIAFKTLSAVHKGKFQFLHEDCQILWLMEFCLIAGDVFHMLYYPFEPSFIYVRAAFIFFSLFNMIGISYIMWKYKLFSITYQGHKEKRRSTLTRMAVKSLVSLWKENSSSKNRVHAAGSVDVEDGVRVQPSSEPSQPALGNASLDSTDTRGNAVPEPEPEAKSNRGHPIFGENFGAQSDSSDDDDDDVEAQNGRSSNSHSHSKRSSDPSSTSYLQPFSAPSTSSKANRSDKYAVAPGAASDSQVGDNSLNAPAATTAAAVAEDRSSPPTEPVGDALDNV